MPEFNRFKLNESVASALQKVSQDLLPDGMRDDPSVEWILQFQRAPEKSLKNLYAERTSIKENPDRWASEAIARWCSSLLKDRVPFYFASLSHIGRVRTVATWSIEQCTTLRQGEGFEASSRRLAQYLIDSGRTQHNAAACLDRLCNAATNLQTDRLEMAEQWWSQWLHEVSNLRRTFRAVEEAWNKSRGKDIEYMIDPAIDLWSDCANGSLLKRRMCDEGVQFKLPSAEGTDTANSHWIPLFMIAVGLRYGPRYPDFYHFSHVVHDAVRRWSAFNDRRQQNMVDRPIMDALSAKYGVKNPFDPFKPGRAAATRELRDLVLENQLPSGEKSSWLQSWSAGLERLTDTESALPKTSDSVDVPNDWAILTGDSEIKANLTAPLEANEDWKAFTQRLFAEMWIDSITAMAIRANKASTDEVVIWSASELTAYISRTVDGLNELGYELIGLPRATVAEILGVADDEERPRGTKLST